MILPRHTPRAEGGVGGGGGGAYLTGSSGTPRSQFSVVLCSGLTN